MTHLRPALLPLLLAVLAAGCNPPATPDAPPNGPGTGSSGAGETRTVGVALASMNHNFFIGMRQGVEEELAAQGLKAEIVVADDSATSQQQQVDQLVTQKKVDAVIMVPVDATQGVNAVKAANAAGTPIFCIDRRVIAEGAEVASTVETDNVAMGEMAARHALKLLCDRHGLDADKPEDVKKLKSAVVHVWGLEAASSAQDRAKGFERVFGAQATPGVVIHKAVGNFNAKTSQEQLAPLLTKHPEIELVFCHNDDNAIGALNAVKDVKGGREKADDPKRVLIVGMDGNKPVIEAIRAGEIEATVSQEPIEMGRETVRQVKKVLDGGRPDKPYIAIRHHLLTKTEADAKKGELWADLLKG
jgi:ribose transport system substrate-binding protein